MLKFELKSNYMMWLFYIVSFVALFSFLSYHSGIIPFFDEKCLPIITLITFVFTINSYQESVRQQTMQMYHLIPVSKNIKFFSKQFITLIAFPLILYFFALICTSVLTFTTDLPPSTGSFRISVAGQLSTSSLSLFIMFILSHSICTFFAIIFKKNKVLYAILVYFGFKFSLGIILLAAFWLMGIKNTSVGLFSITPYPSGDWVPIGSGLLLIVFYGLSYHLFLRRQL